MRKVFIVLSIIVCSITIYAQDTTSTQLITTDTAALNPLLYNYAANSITNKFNEQWRSGARNRVTIDFDYFANANGIPASMVYKFLFKGEISNALKDRAANRIKKMMRFEDNMNTGLTYRHYFPKWDGQVIAGYHHRQMRNLSATKETFQTLFYGNAMFEGDTADLSNLNVLNVIYNQYSLGMLKNIDYGTYKMQVGVSLSFLQCFNSQQIQTREAWIYTAPDADSLVINYDLTFNTAREGATKYGQLNGIGGTADFNLAFMKDNKWKVSLDIYDVGLLAFRKTPTNYSAAKYIVFKGITLPDLTSFSAQTFDTLKLDSALKANLPSKTANGYYMFMPFTAQLVFSKPVLHDKLVLSAGLQYRYLPGYILYGFAKANYFIKRDMVFSVTAGGGAYSWFNLGVEFSKSWKYFDFTIGTGNLLGVLAPSHMPGTAVYLRLGSAF